MSAPTADGLNELQHLELQENAPSVSVLQTEAVQSNSDVEQSHHAEGETVNSAPPTIQEVAPNSTSTPIPAGGSLDPSGTPTSTPVSVGIVQDPAVDNTPGSPTMSTMPSTSDAGNTIMLQQ